MHRQVGVRQQASLPSQAAIYLQRAPALAHLLTRSYRAASSLLQISVQQVRIDAVHVLLGGARLRQRLEAHDEESSSVRLLGQRKGWCNARLPVKDGSIAAGVCIKVMSSAQILHIV